MTNQLLQQRRDAIRVVRNDYFRVFRCLSVISKELERRGWDKNGTEWNHYQSPLNLDTIVTYCAGIHFNHPNQVRLLNAYINAAVRSLTNGQTTSYVAYENATRCKRTVENIGGLIALALRNLTVDVINFDQDFNPTAIARDPLLIERRA